MVYFLQIWQANRATTHHALVTCHVLRTEHGSVSTSHGYGLTDVGRVAQLFLEALSNSTAATRHRRFQLYIVRVDLADVEGVQSLASGLFLLRLSVKLVRLNI